VVAVESTNVVRTLATTLKLLETRKAFAKASPHENNRSVDVVGQTKLRHGTNTRFGANVVVIYHVVGGKRSSTAISETDDTFF